MELVFIRGGSIRRVFIKDRVISLVTPELNFTPFHIDLDRLDDPEMRERINKANLSSKEIEDLDKLAKLGNDKEISKDIIKDFQQSGWRKVRRNDNS